MVGMETVAPEWLNVGRATEILGLGGCAGPESFRFRVTVAGLEDPLDNFPLIVAFD